MLINRTSLFVTLCLAGAASSRAHADTGEVDVRSFEYLDVVETTDGSIWKGVVVEQTPNVQYKIATSDGSMHVIKAADVVKMSKQKNRDYGGSAAIVTGGGGGSGGGGNVIQPLGVGHHYEQGGAGLPAPFAKSGLRIDPSMLVVIPAGDIAMTNTSFTPSVQVGYEQLFGNFGLGGGGLARFTYWRLPGQTEDAAWTLETHAYVRAALHISRVAIYGGASLGADTNLVHVAALNMSQTKLGFGMNIQSGVEVAATDTLALEAGFDYHPGTDTIVDGAPASISYYGLLFGVTLRM